jgi:hypothetical protein
MIAACHEWQSALTLAAWQSKRLIFAGGQLEDGRTATITFVQIARQSLQHPLDRKAVW